MAVNVLLFFVFFSRNRTHLRFLHRYGLNPDDLRVLQFVTYQFLHGGFIHLCGNLLFLWIFGRNIERVLGPGLFLLGYLVLGSFAGFTHLVTSNQAAIGASGAISGLLGLYLILFPSNQVSVFYFIFIDIGVIRVPAWLFVLVFEGLQQLVALLSNHEHIAFAAHFGGLLGGLTTGTLILLIFGSRIILSRSAKDQSTGREDPTGNTEQEDSSQTTTNQMCLFNVSLVPIPNNFLDAVLTRTGVGKSARTIASSSPSQRVFPVTNLTKKQAHEVAQALATKNIELQPVSEQHRLDRPPYLNVIDQSHEDNEILFKAESGGRYRVKIQDLFAVNAGRFPSGTKESSTTDRWVVDVIVRDPWLGLRRTGDLFNDGSAEGIAPVKTLLEFFYRNRKDERIPDDLQSRIDEEANHLPEFASLNDFDTHTLWFLNWLQLSAFHDGVSKG